MMDAMKLYAVLQSSQKDCLGETDFEVNDAASCLKDLTDTVTHVQDIVA